MDNKVDNVSGFRLTGPSASELSRLAEKNVEARGYTPEELSFAATPVEYDIATDYHVFDFNLLDKVSGYDCHHQLSGKGIKNKIKKFLFRLFAWCLVPALENQRYFNQLLINDMHEMYREINSLRKRVREFEKAQTEQSPPGSTS